MLKVGLTGGFATGKSHVAAALASFGCHVIKADELGHQVLRRGGAAFAGVVREFGSGILGESGEINRRRLAAAVFDNPGRLALLNSLVHPHVIQLEERRMAEIEAAEPRAITVVEAAILIETGSYRRFDRLILAVCGEADQIARGMRRDGISEQEARARIARQMPLEDKRRYANFIVDTSGTREDTLEQTRRVFGALQAIAQAVPPRQNE